MPVVVQCIVGDAVKTAEVETEEPRLHSNLLTLLGEGGRKRPPDGAPVTRRVCRLGPGLGISLTSLPPLCPSTVSKANIGKDHGLPCVSTDFVSGSNLNQR